MSLSNQAHPLPDFQQKLLSDVLRWLLRQRRAVRRLISGFAARRRRARAMAELYSFSDRDLHDLALTRADVHAIDKGRFSRD